MTALLLICLHMLGDFILQSHDMSQRKLKEANVRTAHVTIYTACFVVPALLWTTEPQMVLTMIFVSHWIIDSRRWCSAEWPPKPIIVDQAMHLMALWAIFYAAGVR